MKKYLTKFLALSLVVGMLPISSMVYASPTPEVTKINESIVLMNDEDVDIEPTHDFIGRDEPREESNLVAVYSNDEAIREGYPIKNIILDITGDVTNIDILGLPKGVTYNPEHRVITGTPQVDDWFEDESLRTFELEIIADNTTEKVDITIHASNVALEDREIYNPLTHDYEGKDSSKEDSVLSSDDIVSQAIEEGYAIEDIVLNLTGDASNIGILGLPEGVSYDAENKTISGTPIVSNWLSDEYDRELEVTVSASNLTKTFDIVVTKDETIVEDEDKVALGSLIAQYVEVDELGEEVKAFASSFIVVDIEVGAEYKLENKNFNGYTFKGLSEESAPLQGKIVEGTTVVVFEYTKDIIVDEEEDKDEDKLPDEDKDEDKLPDEDKDDDKLPEEDKDEDDIVNELNTVMDKKTSIIAKYYDLDFDGKVKLDISDAFRTIKDKDVLKTYNIKFIDVETNQEVEPLNPIEISIPLGDIDSKDLDLYHEVKKDEYEKIKYTINDKHIIFKSSDFSVYVLAKDVKDEVVEELDRVGKVSIKHVTFDENFEPVTLDQGEIVEVPEDFTVDSFNFNDLPNIKNFEGYVFHGITLGEVDLSLDTSKIVSENSATTVLYYLYVEELSLDKTIDRAESYIAKLAKEGDLKEETFKSATDPIKKLINEGKELLKDPKATDEQKRHKADEIDVAVIYSMTGGLILTEFNTDRYPAFDDGVRRPDYKNMSFLDEIDDKDKIEEVIMDIEKELKPQTDDKSNSPMVLGGILLMGSAIGGLWFVRKNKKEEETNI